MSLDGSELRSSGCDRLDPASPRALFLHPAREHYVVYEPLAERFIATMGVIRQGCDIPAILQKWAAPIRRELIEIRSKIERGGIRVPARQASKPSRKK